MYGHGLTRYPHLLWLAYGVCIKAPQTFVLHEYKSVAHQLVIAEEGYADLSWGSRGTAVSCAANSCGLVFCPADRGLHSLGITSAGGYGGTCCSSRAHMSRACVREKAHGATWTVSPFGAFGIHSWWRRRTGFVEARRAVALPRTSVRKSLHGR